MCRHATRTLPPEPGSARAARRFLQEQLEAWDLLELLDDALLALSELVNNGVMHARTPLVVSASCENGRVEIAVFDGHKGLPTVRPARRDLLSDLDRAARVEAEHEAELDDRDPRLHVGAAGSVAGGRGLLLVDALSAEWGVSPQSDGKAVWVRAPAPRDWPHARGCPCSTSPEAVTLASGARVVHRQEAASPS